MAIKYREDKDFREFTAVNKLLSRMTGTQLQMSYIL